MAPLISTNRTPIDARPLPYSVYADQHSDTSSAEESEHPPTPPRNPPAIDAQPAAPAAPAPAAAVSQPVQARMFAAQPQPGPSSAPNHALQTQTALQQANKAKDQAPVVSMVASQAPYSAAPPPGAPASQTINASQPAPAPAPVPALTSAPASAPARRVSPPRVIAVHPPSDVSDDASDLSGSNFNATPGMARQDTDDDPSPLSSPVSTNPQSLSHSLSPYKPK